MEIETVYVVHSYEHGPAGVCATKELAEDMKAKVQQGYSASGSNTQVVITPFIFVK